MINKKDAGFIFWNPAHNTKLIIPNYRKGQNFSHLKNFMDNADEEQQSEFWKIVVKAIEEELIKMKPNDLLYVSTHGHGIAYLHVRIEYNKPKYFDPNSNLKYYKFL